MNILFISDTLKSGGKERRLIELIMELSDRGEFTPILILTKGINSSQSIDYKYFLQKDIKIYYLGNCNRFSLMIKVFRICRIENIKIINIWSPIVDTYSIYPSKLLLKIPIISNSITSARNTYSWFEFLKIKGTYFMCDKILSNTYQALKVFKVPEVKKLVIYNGFNKDRLKNLVNKNSIRQKLDIKSKYIVSMAAEYSNRKDYPTYIEAANIILKQGYDVTFLCMGSGDFTPYSKLVDNKFNNNIKFLNRQSDVESIINASDIGVLASFVEGLPNFILECMALAKPVVANFGKGVGTNELVTDSKNGYLVQAKNPIIFSERIIRLLENEKLRFIMGKHGQKIVKNKFNLKKMVDLFSNLFNEYKNLTT